MPGDPSPSRPGGTPSPGREGSPTAGGMIGGTRHGGLDGSTHGALGGTRSSGALGPGMTSGPSVGSAAKREWPANVRPTPRLQRDRFQRIEHSFARLWIFLNTPALLRGRPLGAG